jgi:hypothetical protein
MTQPEEQNDSQSRRRWKLGRWDVIAVLVLILIFLGLVLPGAQRIRDGNGPRCQNNLRQISLAALSAASAHSRLPPAFGAYGNRPPAVKTAAGEIPHSATLFYHLLPFVEAAGAYGRLPPVFDYPQPNQYVVAPNQPLGGAPDENAAACNIKVYQCPSDLSSDASGIVELSLDPGKQAPSPWGLNSYAANYLLFGMVKQPRLPESVSDGLSVTIFFAEKAARCDDRAAGRQGGNLWAVPPFFPADPEARVNYGGTIGFDPAASNQFRPFAMGMFQVEPAPGQCNPVLAQSPHRGVIHVSMGDGSVRSIAATISPRTWSALLTPYPVNNPKFPGGPQNRSDVPGGDWQ